MLKRSRRLISFSVIAAVLLVLAAVSGFKLKTIAQPTAKASAPSPTPPITCGACHSMDKEVSAWLASAHEAVSCLECHTEGSAEAIRAEIMDPGATMAGHPATGPVTAIPLQVSDDSCRGCHASQLESLMKDVIPTPMRETPATGGAPGKPMQVRAMHDLHVNGKPDLACDQCHLDAVHGPEPGSTERRDSMHALCQECHVQQKVILAVPGDVSCVACHVDPTSIAPADHKNQGQWLANHGAATPSGNCGQCHLSGSAGPHTALSDPAAFAAPAGDACAACHGGVPMPHQSGYLAAHGQTALRVGAGTCEACHSGRSPITGGPTAATQKDCTSCHAQPMPHPAGFAASHGQAALAAPATCTACHSSKNPANPGASHASPQFCSSCHNSYSHPANWLPVHGSRVNSSCATCHTMPGAQGNKNPCATCHTGGAWHPDLWYVSHARVVEQQGKAACMKCHDWVSPSCTKCHRNP